MECPICFGEINERAKKCKHCGEWVTGAERASESFSSRSVRDEEKGNIQGFFEGESLDETLNHGVKAYVQYKVVTGVIGFIVFLIIFFVFFMPEFNSMKKGPSGFMNGHEIDIQQLNFLPK